MSGMPEAEPPYRFQFVEAPADLAPCINSLYYWETEATEFADTLPAYSGQLVCFIDGSGTLTLPDGTTQFKTDGFFLAPMMAARDFRVEGPARLFGVSLNFRGWAALTNLSVAVWSDCVFDLEEGMGTELADEFRQLGADRRSGAIDDAGMFAGMSEIMRKGFRELPEQHATVIEHTHKWLSTSFKPDLDDLYDALPYSERQVQRLVSRFFGQSPIRLIRRYRAVRAATLLSFPGLPDAIEAEIRDAFYDQAHMIKEIKLFTGRTPRRLLPAESSVVSDSLGPDGYGSVNLYAGIEAEQLGRDYEDY